MQVSDYLRMKLQSDRQLSLYTEHGFTSFAQATRSTLSDIYAGVERVSWYSSCLIPRYGDVCSELMTEDKRLFLSLESVFRYRDVILFMLVLYFKMLEEDRQNENKEGKVQGLTKSVAGYFSHSISAKETRMAMSYALAKVIEGSGVASTLIIQRISKLSPHFIMGLQLYGIGQEAAMAARHLKIIEPRYYSILYNAQLEMLYYFIEPILFDIIQKVQSKTYKNLDELYEALASKYNV